MFCAVDAVKMLNYKRRVDLGVGYSDLRTWNGTINRTRSYALLVGSTATGNVGTPVPLTRLTLLVGAHTKR